MSNDNLDNDRERNEDSTADVIAAVALVVVFVVAAIVWISSQ